MHLGTQVMPKMIVCRIDCWNLDQPCLSEHLSLLRWIELIQRNPQSHVLSNPRSHTMSPSSNATFAYKSRKWYRSRSSALAGRVYSPPEQHLRTTIDGSVKITIFVRAASPHSVEPVGTVTHTNSSASVVLRSTWTASSRSVVMWLSHSPTFRAHALHRSLLRERVVWLVFHWTRECCTRYNPRPDTVGHIPSSTMNNTYAHKWRWTGVGWWRLENFAAQAVLMSVVIVASGFSEIFSVLNWKMQASKGGKVGSEG